MAKSKKVNTRSSTMIVRSVPRSLRDQFKASCARRGITMTNKLLELMREAIRKDEEILAATSRGLSP